MNSSPWIAHLAKTSKNDFFGAAAWDDDVGLIKKRLIFEVNRGRCWKWIEDKETGPFDENKRENEIKSVGNQFWGVCVVFWMCGFRFLCFLCRFNGFLKAPLLLMNAGVLRDSSPLCVSCVGWVVVSGKVLLRWVGVVLRLFWMFFASFWAWGSCGRVVGRRGWSLVLCVEMLSWRGSKRLVWGGERWCQGVFRCF